jgi:DNA-directed RNA polymerase subunit RPC12/RpoP
MENENISKCPFCGDEAELITRGNDNTKKRSAEIECTNCHVKMVVGAIRNTTEWCIRTVLEKWNNRSNTL